MHILFVTSEWPTPEHPEWVPFVVQQASCLRDVGNEVDVFSFRGSKSVFNSFRAWLHMRGKLGSKHYDIIHAQFGQSGLVALPTAIPLVVTFHGSDLQGWIGESGTFTLTGRLLQKISRLVARQADQIIIVSEHLKKYLPADLSVHTIPGGIDLKLFTPIPRSQAREQLVLPLNKRLILFAGDPNNPIKRYPLAAQACKLIRDDFDADLVLARNIPHHLMPVYMNACDVLLLTSKHEGSPTVIKESLACNLPIVSTDVGDVRERIGSIDGCVICEDEQPQTIAKGLAVVLKRNSRLDVRAALSDIDEKVTTQKILGVYKRALAVG